MFSFISSLLKSQNINFGNFSESWMDEDGEMSLLHQINPLRISFVLNSIQNHFLHRKRYFSPIYIDEKLNIVPNEKYKEYKDHSSLIEIASQREITSLLNAFKEQQFNSSNLESLNIDTASQYSVLDVGCGGGIFTEPMQKLGFRCTGIDSSSELIEVAQKLSKQNAIASTCCYMSGDCKALFEQFALEAKSFNIVTCLEVLEHIEDWQGFLLDMIKLVAHEGLLIISTIDKTIASFLKTIVCAEYILKKIPKKTHDWSKFISPKEILQLLNGNFEMIDCAHLTFNFKECGWSMQKGLGDNYILCMKKI